MKKSVYRVAAAMAALIVTAGTLKVPVYAAEEMTDEAAVTDEILEGEEASDDAMEGEMAADESVASDDSGYANVSSPDGTLTIYGSIPDEMVPITFSKAAIDYSGQTVEGAISADSSITLLYVMDNSGNSYFVRYDSATGNLENFRMIQGPGDNFIMVLNPDETVVPPEGFEEASLDWNGQTLTAYINPSEGVMGAQSSPSEYFLLYATSNTGFTGFYQYDQTEGTYQRYLDLGNTSAKTSGKLIDIAAVKDGDSSALVRVIIVGVMALIIILLVVTVIILAVKLKEYSGYEYIDEEDYNALNGGYPEMPAPVSHEPKQSINAAGPEKTVPNRNDGDEKAAAPDRNQAPRKKAPVRRNLMETGDIADLDDILNESEPEKDYDRMQVSVDSFSPGMPAMVDTDMIAEDIGEVDGSGRTPSGRITGEMDFAMEGYSADDGYSYNSRNKGGADGSKNDAYYQNNDYYGDDEDLYDLSRAEKKERKAALKQKKREEKEAEKDAKYMEKERKRAEKRKKYGYEEPTAMDWSTFSDNVMQAEDERRPVGNNADTMPAYMSGEAIRNGSHTSADTKPLGENAPESGNDRKASTGDIKKHVMTEDEKADAVIRAARGSNYSEEDEAAKKAAAREVKKEQDYQAYRQGARNQYEEFKRQDEEEARRREMIENRGRSKPVHKNPEFTQDLDEDFEFEFLNIRHPS